MSTDHLGMASPQIDKFRWSAHNRTLRLLRWNQHVSLPASNRLALCKTISLVVSGTGSTKEIEEAATKFGIRADGTRPLADIVTVLLCACGGHASQDRRIAIADMTVVHNNVDDAVESV